MLKEVPGCAAQPRDFHGNQQYLSDFDSNEG
jgi:hypothetical protein